ncbi:alpha/beta hydrolase [Priestia megaterium]|uniref:alpha/beta hydrolase n=1 Tax=Priestia megaterium TaxID=1404 RepID=UPI0027308C98|nr:alpha/beta hydrolase [Priestia megaterium]MDP1383355.1 alpha/beta hydrolase [Priestia megaterium]MDP1427503.1 alpha/beta hydrolase [Priestia megaterium]
MSNYKDIQKANNFFKDNIPDFTIPVEELRVQAEKMYGKLPVADDVATEKVDINGMEGEWQIVPESKGDRVLLYLHGGGFLFGSIASHRGETSELGRAAKARTLAINYRLAPEHSFPAPIEDALKAYTWLLDQGYDAKNIIIAGESAGGSMTAGLLMSIRDTKLPLPAGGVMISPWIDLAQTGETYITKEGIDPMNSTAGVKYLAETYLNGTSPEAPLASPIYGDLRGLPPIYVMVGEVEVMLSEALTFVNNAALAGIDIRFRSFPGMVHNWPAFHSFLEEGKEAILSAGDFMNEIFSKQTK